MKIVLHINGQGLEFEATDFKGVDFVVNPEGETLQGPVKFLVKGGVLKVLRPDGSFGVAFETNRARAGEISIELAVGQTTIDTVSVSDETKE